MKRFIFSLVGSILVLPVALQLSAYAAAGVTLSPSSKSVGQGSTFTIRVSENSGGEAVNAAKVVLNYPANLIDYVSVSSSSAFSIVAATSGGGGSVSIDRGALPAVSGSQTIATVRFKAKVNAGTATISAVGGTSVVSASSNANIVGGLGSASVTLTPPVVAVAPVQVPKDTTAPVIKNVAITDVSANTASVTWTTDEASNSQVLYGPTNQYGVVALDNNMTTVHKVTLNSAVLTPATKYHFLVKSADAAGNTAQDTDQILSTKGLSLQVSVATKDKKPASGAVVSIGGVKGATDKQGQVTLSGLPLGNLTGTLNYKGKESVIKVTLDTVDPTGKPVALALTAEASSSSLPKALLGIATLLLLAAFVLVVFKRRPGSGAGSGSSGGGSGSRVVGTMTSLLAGVQKLRPTKNDTSSGADVVVGGGMPEDRSGPALTDPLQKTEVISPNSDSSGSEPAGPKPPATPTA